MSTLGGLGFCVASLRRHSLVYYANQLYIIPEGSLTAYINIHFEKASSGFEEAHLSGFQNKVLPKSLLAHTPLWTVAVIDVLLLRALDQAASLKTTKKDFVLRLGKQHTKTLSLS